jgi:uncharacterized membrane protein
LSSEKTNQNIVEDKKEDNYIEDASSKKANMKAIVVFVGIIGLGVAGLIGWQKYQPSSNLVSETSNIEPKKTTVSTISAMPITGLLYIDVNKLISSKTKMIMNDPNKESGYAMSESKKFSENLHEAMNEYRKNGIMVLDINSVIISPEGKDITNIIAVKLGIEMEK